MARFDLGDFLVRTGVSITRLATYLRVAPSYLQSVLDGTGRLTSRDQQACRQLLRRLFQAKQMELPFAEPPSTFTKAHAQARSRLKERQSAARSVRRKKLSG